LAVKADNTILFVINLILCSISFMVWYLWTGYFNYPNKFANINQLLMIGLYCSIDFTLSTKMMLG